MSDFFFNSRLNCKQTQQEFAKSCGIKQSYWSKIENFKVIPRIEVLCKVSKNLDIPPCELVKLYVCYTCKHKDTCNYKFEYK